MAGFISDSDDDKAVEEVLSQAMDMTVLEQVVAINCAGFNHSDLPPNLETRFQKLKSFPPSTKFPSTIEPKTSQFGQKSNPSAFEKELEPNEKVHSTRSTKCPNEKISVSPAKSYDSGTSSPFKKNPELKLGKKKVEKKESPSSFWDDLSSRSVSPPAKSGCFMCSPKKVLSRNKSKENRGLDLGLKNNDDDELLSDLSMFSSKSRNKLMKKAMVEEEKICREAEKIVNWAKQASSKMEFSDDDDELSDSENNYKFM